MANEAGVGGVVIAGVGLVCTLADPDNVLLHTHSDSLFMLPAVAVQRLLLGPDVLHFFNKEQCVVYKRLYAENSIYPMDFSKVVVPGTRVIDVKLANLALDKRMLYKVGTGSGFFSVEMENRIAAELAKEGYPSPKKA